METGEITEIPTDIKKNKKNDGRVYFNNNARFKRHFENAWDLLESLTNDREYLVAIKLSKLAKSFSSSLEPLNDETSVRELSRILKRDKRAITKILAKLYDLGVYAKFSVTDKDYKEKKYWMFNPYLSFNGTHIDEDTLILFKNTRFSPKNLK